MKLTLEELDALLYFVIKTIKVEELNHLEYEAIVIINSLYKKIEKKLENKKRKEALAQAIEDGIYE
jgi:Mn-containing catalase